MMHIKLNLLLILVLTFGVSCTKSRDEHPQPTTTESIPLPNMNVNEYRITQPLDHFNLSSPTFSQRYYLFLEFARLGEQAPVLFFLCPEGFCSSSLVRDSASHYARELGAIIVGIELRFYGESTPYQGLYSPNRDQLQYLTIDQNLEDFLNLQLHLQKQEGLKGPWLIFGGSYSGILAAYYRATYPAKTIGALVSGAPVLPYLIGPKLDEAAAIRVDQKCREKSNFLLSIASLIYGTMDTREDSKIRWKAMKQDFGIEHLSDLDAISFILTSPLLLVQYGFKTELCEGVQHALRGLGTVVRDLGFSPPPIPNSTPDNWSYIFRYQMCTELGLFYTSSTTEMTIAPSLTLDYVSKECEKLFGEAMVKYENLVTHRYLEKLKSSQLKNLIFVNGEDDPWSHFSITPDNAQSINPNFDTLLIKDGGHCADLAPLKSSDSESLTRARTKILEIFSTWVKSTDNELL